MSWRSLFVAAVGWVRILTMGDVVSSRVLLYRGSFARRTAAVVAADLTRVDQPGLYGIYGTVEHPGGRVLITDDRAAALLEALIPNLYPLVVNVFRAAVHCTEMVRQAARWHGEPATSMIFCRDLSSAPTTLTLPAGPSVRRVRRVPLEDAARAGLDADPQMAGVPLAGFLDYLRSIPHTTQLLAAVDAQGVVRATAGCSVFDADANTFFVNTDPMWRKQGVATAWMTHDTAAWVCSEPAAAGDGRRGPRTRHLVCGRDLRTVPTPRVDQRAVEVQLRLWEAADTATSDPDGHDGSKAGFLASNRDLSTPCWNWSCSWPGSPS